MLLLAGAHGIAGPPRYSFVQKVDDDGVNWSVEASRAERVAVSSQNSEPTLEARIVRTLRFAIDCPSAVPKSQRRAGDSATAREDERSGHATVRPSPLPSATKNDQRPTEKKDTDEQNHSPPRLKQNVPTVTDRPVREASDFFSLVRNGARRRLPEKDAATS